MHRPSGPSAALALAFRVAPAHTGICVALGLLTGAAAAPAGWLASETVDQLTTHGSTRQITLLILAQGAITLVGFVSAYAAGIAAAHAKGRLRIHCEVRLAERMAQRIGVEHLHDPARLNEIHLARRAAHEAPSVAVELLVQILSAVTTVVTFTVVLAATWPWMIVALAATAIPAALIQKRMMQRAVDVATTASESYRWADYYAELPYEAGAARVLRLHSALDPCTHRLRTHLKDAVQREIEHTVLTATKQVIFTVASAGVITAGTLVVGLGAVNGQASVGQFVLFGIAVTAVQRAVFSTISSVGAAGPSLAAFATYARLIEGPPTATAPAAFDAVPPLRDAIVFTDVWFTYPGNEAPTIRGLSLRFDAGTTHALVGANGAGKSTILALLLRLYEPDSGSITWDGRPITDFPAASLRQRISMVLQDSPRLEMSVHDIIALDDLDGASSRTAVVEAACTAGADGFIDRLHDGYDTILGTGRVGGTSVSGGQWQRLALARSAMRDAEVRVFDEPTNGLDAYAQASYLEAVLRLGAGKTSVVVSHHFLQLGRADWITVIADGTVREAGSHEDLLALGGSYAEMYNLQSPITFERARAGMR